MNVSLNGATYEINQTTKIPIAQGRYFLPFEADNGLMVAIIGAEVAENLNITSVNTEQSIKINGIKFKVIGVIEKKGEDAINMGGSPDQMIYIPYVAFAKIFQKDRPSPEIVLKAFDSDVNQEKLEAEVTGLLRSLRSIKPKEESDFSVNRLDGLNQFFDTIFSTLNIAGSLIAGFSLLVGGFGIANIMFVSVKERTNIIGIQKSLGAKNYFILFQFLFEAVFLSLIGGLVGLFLVFLITLIPQEFLPMSLSIGNMSKGILISSIIGVLSGIVPAWFAAKLDPVIAIRAK
jgi:putative ABC transport system permease protein